MKKRVKNKDKELRYLVHYWVDYYNDHDRYRHSERSFSNKQDAIDSALDFVNNHDQAMVLDLYKEVSDEGRVVYSSSP